MVKTNRNLTLQMNELESADLPLDEFISLEISHNNVKYEFLVRFSSTNKNLICFGSGAYTPNENLTPPIYRRHSWQSEFEESVIYYNDPSLYNHPQLNLGWGVGKNDDWYLLTIKDIISKLAHKNGIKPKDTLFFGSSGGGFTALMLSAMTKDSSVIVNNPQIFLVNYHKNFFNRMIKYCFDDTDLENILSKYGHRFDVTEIFKRENYIPLMTYLVNISSENDVKNQFVPFISRLSSLEDFKKKVEVILYRDEGGHEAVFNTIETIIMIKNHFTNLKEQDLQVESWNPPSDAVNVPLNQKIQVKFNGPVHWGNDYIELKNASDGSIVPIKKNIHGDRLTITPESPLDNNIKYNVIIHTDSLINEKGGYINVQSSFFTTQDSYTKSRNPFRFFKRPP